jgi:H/ACA ribonucleoprotein complex subunit 3
MKHIYKCPKCLSYTIKIKCSKCDGKTIAPKPPKFALNDKYDPMRREIRKKELEEKGLL